MDFMPLDTLGIEPRASRMLSDVIPLHHVPTRHTVRGALH